MRRWQKRTLVCATFFLSLESQDHGSSSWCLEIARTGEYVERDNAFERYFVGKKKKEREKKAGRRWRALQGEKMAHRGGSGSRLPWMSLAFDRVRRESAIQFYNYEIANGAATLPVPLGDASAFSFGERERGFSRGTSSVCSCYCSSSWISIYNNFQRLLFLLLSFINPSLTISFFFYQIYLDIY